MLDARLGGLCASCEAKERYIKDRGDRRIALVLLVILVWGVICSAAWGVIKFIAVMKWILM